MDTILRAAFQAELTRLLAYDLTPEETEIARRYYSQKERQSMDESDFCGPHRSFPVTDQEDVTNAAHLVGHADNPKAVRACIVGKAKSHGWTLPDSWEKDERAVEVDESGNHEKMSGSHAHHHNAYGAQGGDNGHNHSHSHDNDNDHHHSHTEKRASEVEVDGDGNHEKMSGSHSHKHKAYGAYGENDMHSHKHSHQNDNSHKHEHESKEEKADTPDILRSMPAETTLFAPITRIDRTKREVVVRATAEDLDSYGTVISFDASKEAFAKWRGNIREMHDANKAIGRAIKWEPIDDEKAIDLTLRVSRGAEDTWQKVLDGTLSGASIGARNGKWQKRVWKGKEVPILDRYDLVEVSLVDNPSCPGCDIKIVRSAGAEFEVTDILDFSEEPAPAPAQVEEDIERRGARVATNTMSSMHKSRDHALQGVREMLSNCSCDECQGALRVLDPDGDGDIDIVASLDTDHDAGGAGNIMGNAAAGDGSGVMKAVQVEIQRQLAPMIQRMQGVAARFATSTTETIPDLSTMATDVVAALQPELARRMDLLEQKLTRLDEVHSALAEVKGLAELIAAQPAPGGPIINSAAMRDAASGLSGAGQIDMTAIEAEIIARLSKSGILSQSQQVNAALYLQKQAQTSARR